MECSCSHPPSPFIHFERWITHALTCTLTCTLTHVRTVPRPVSGRDTSAAHPNHPAPGPAASPHPPALHVGAPRRPAASLPTSPSQPRSGREGAALGSDGQSGRPIEPGTAFPKGGRCSSDGPNERGARVGLPPGIPLARLAGLWVTRKLGGRRRRRRPRLRSPVSDSGPPSPKPGRPPPSPPLVTQTPRAARGGAAWSPGPFVGRAPPPFGGNEVAQWAPPRGGGERPGRDCECRRGAVGPKSGEQEAGQARPGIGQDTPLRSMRRAPSRAPALAESQPRKSLAAAAPAASMAARPAARGG